jgi:hypothetical protein
MLKLKRKTHYTKLNMRLVIYLENKISHQVLLQAFDTG